MKIDWTISPKLAPEYRFGTFSYDEYDNKDDNIPENIQRIHIGYIRGSGGFGTKAVGHIIAIHPNSSYFRLDASWDSYLFHLYMGFMPEKKTYFYLAYTYGLSYDHIVYEAMHNIREKQNLESYQLDVLNTIYRKEEQLPETTPALTLAEIEEKYDYFCGFKKREVPYMEKVFILRLEKYLLEYSRNPDCKSGNFMPHEHYILSEEGLARWRETIKTGSAFKPFYDLSHLHSYMDEATKTRICGYLKTIYDRKHKPAESVANNSASFFHHSETENSHAQEHTETATLSESEVRGSNVKT